MSTEEQVLEESMLSGPILVHACTSLIIFVTAMLFKLRRKGPKVGLEELGVGNSYNWCGLPYEEIEEYEKLKQSMKEMFAENAKDDSWMAELGENPKNLLKHKLIFRAVADIECLNTIQQDRKGMSRLFLSKFITQATWDDFNNAESEVSSELAAIQAESVLIMPGTNSQQFIQEAVSLWRMYGAKMNINSSSSESAAEPKESGSESVSEELADSDEDEVSPTESKQAAPKVRQSRPSGELKKGMLKWTQDDTTLEITVELSKGAKRKDIVVDMKKNHLCIKVKGTTVVNGKLWKAIDAEMSTFTIEKNLFIILEKDESGDWEALMKN